MLFAPSPNERAVINDRARSSAALTSSLRVHLIRLSTFRLFKNEKNEPLRLKIPTSVTKRTGPTSSCTADRLLVAPALPPDDRERGVLAGAADLPAADEPEEGENDGASSGAGGASGRWRGGLSAGAADLAATEDGASDGAASGAGGAASCRSAAVRKPWLEKVSPHTLYLCMKLMASDARLLFLLTLPVVIYMREQFAILFHAFSIKPRPVMHGSSTKERRKRVTSALRDRCNRGLNHPDEVCYILKEILASRERAKA